MSQFGTQLIHQSLGKFAHSFRVFTVPCLTDNYAWIIQDVASGAIGIVDTPSALPIISFIKTLPLVGKVTVLNTHHHRDHTGGNLVIKEAFGAEIVGPAKERIPGIDRALVEGDTVYIGDSLQCRVIDIPGHTAGHIGYVFDDIMVFVGDTLFGHGCGALFEGSPLQMWNSLTKISDLHPNTLVFCAHEYTLSNVLFAMEVFPDNAELKSVYAEVKRLRDSGEQTVPSLLQQELNTNPFLQARLSETQARFNKGDAIETFAHLRQTKDAWKPT